jgi:hypothetical protein
VGAAEVHGATAASALDDVDPPGSGRPPATHRAEAPGPGERAVGGRRSAFGRRTITSAVVA